MPSQVQHPSKRLASSGFTLLELVIVMLLIGIMVAAAIPQFNAGQRAIQSRAAVRSVMSALKLARANAMTERRQIAIIFNSQTHSFKPDNGAEVKFPEYVDVHVDSADFAEVAESLEAEGKVRILFFPDGGSNGGNVFIESTGKKYLLRVDWLTGRVVLSDV